MIPHGSIRGADPVRRPTSRFGPATRYTERRWSRRPTPRPAFAHASEAEFARILDFYEVRWEYEPHVFPILWNLDGLVVESFSPDFWLPDLELYVEMTTLQQSLVRKKNRKLRRLRELYPDIRIKLFYGRDFRALMLKYGQLGLIDAMSGTPGQVDAAPTAPPRSPERDRSPRRRSASRPHGPSRPVEPIAAPAEPLAAAAAPAQPPPAARRRAGARRAGARPPAAASDAPVADAMTARDRRPRGRRRRGAPDRGGDPGPRSPSSARRSAPTTPAVG